MVLTKDRTDALQQENLVQWLVWTFVSMKNSLKILLGAPIEEEPKDVLLLPSTEHQTLHGSFIPETCGHYGSGDFGGASSATR